MNEEYQYNQQETDMSAHSLQESAQVRTRKSNLDNINYLNSQRSNQSQGESQIRYSNLQRTSPGEAHSRNSPDWDQQPTQTQYIQAVRDPSMQKFQNLHKRTTLKWAYFQMDEHKMQAVRLCAAIGIILGFIYNIGPYSKNEMVMEKGECFRDYSFIWTQKINDYLAKNISLKNRYMIYCGFMMDFIQVSSISIFVLRFKTLRGAMTFAFFMMIRQQIQNHFLMGRPKGFLWFNPGMPALTVPYHDTNDFYYSGHVGTACIYMHEYFANGYSIMGYIALFNMINQWVMLMLLHTHYIIDLVSGLIIAHWAIMMGETFSYLVDVKICGWSGPDRKQTAHDPCHSCGWSNNKVSCQINDDEREFLDYTLSLRKSLKKDSAAPDQKDNEKSKSSQS